MACDKKIIIIVILTESQKQSLCVILSPIEMSLNIRTFFPVVYPNYKPMKYLYGLQGVFHTLQSSSV